MPSKHTHGEAAARQVNRREFLKHAGRGGVGATVLLAGAGRAGRASAQSPTQYPDWIPMSTKAPKRGGVMTRASSWDPPVLDPRLTQSVGLFQFAGLTSNRLVRYVLPDEASGTNDLALKGDLAESWQSSTDNRVWTFKVRQGVKWQNIPPLNGRELVAADVKYCFEAYAKEGVQSFNISLKITKLDYTSYYGRYVDGKWDGMAWGFQSGHAVGVDERTYQYMYSKSTKNFFRVNDPVIDELATKLRQTPDRTEQRVITKKIVDRELDQVWRMWMPYDAGFLVFQPHVRNASALSLRRTDGYGSAAVARLWLDK